MIGRMIGIPGALLPVLGLALGLVSVPADAQITIDHAQSGTSNSDYWYIVTKNFASSGATGLNYATWTDPIGQTGVKYTTLELFNPSTETACYDVSTSPGTDANPDTRIWGQSSATAWVNVNDDVGGGSLLSGTRVWIAGSKGVTLRIGAFGTGSNAMDFQLFVRHLLYTNATDCERKDIPYAMVTMTGAWPTFKNNGN